MKLRLKALAAASLLAVAGAASAAIDFSSATETSELFLIAYDPANPITYSFDLGKTMSEFNFGASASFSLTGFSTFLGTAGLDAPNVRWGIVAFDQVTPISTHYTGPTTLGSSTTGNPAQSRISNTNSNMASFATVHNNTGAHATQADGWAVVTITGFGQGSSLFGAAYNFNQGAPGPASALLGTSQRFFSFTNGTSLNSTRTANGSAFGPGTFSIDAATGTLGYTAPVPEPGTYALMLAGLLTLGAVVRRRTK